MSSAINCVGTHKGNIFKITVFIFEEHPYAYGFGIFILFFSIKKKGEKWGWRRIDWDLWSV